jgi:hypothetical protein
MSKFLAALLIAIPAVSFAQAEKEEHWSVTGSAELLRTMPTEGWDPLSLRQFDGRTDGPRLINARLVIRYSDVKGRFMAYLEPWIGDATDVLTDYEPSGSRVVRNLGQAYVRFGDDSQNIEAGKFNSWIGYESPLAADNDHFSRGVLYTLAQPAYHAGVRASKQFSPNFGGTVYVVTGWSQVEGDGAFGAQGRWQADAKTAVTVGLYSGSEGDEQPNDLGSYGGIGFGVPGHARVNLVDVIVTHDVDPTLRFGLNADLAHADGSVEGSWSGIALYARKNIGDKDTVAARFGWVRDSDGLRTGMDSTVNEFILTWTHRLNEQFSVLLEGRHDWASEDLFLVAGSQKSRQTTLSAGVIFRF